MQFSCSRRESNPSQSTVRASDGSNDSTCRAPMRKNGPQLPLHRQLRRRAMLDQTRPHGLAAVSWIDPIDQPLQGIECILPGTVLGVEIQRVPCATFQNAGGNASRFAHRLRCELHFAGTIEQPATRIGAASDRSSAVHDCAKAGQVFRLRWRESVLPHRREL